MIKRKRYLPLAAIAALALTTAGCLHDDDDGPASDGMDMMPGDGATTSEPVALIAGVDRLFASNRTVGLMDDGTTKVMEDTTQTPSGWNLTVDGKTVELDANDLGVYSSFPDYYVKDLGNNEEVWFWSEEEGGFEGDPNPEFHYLNIYGFNHNTFVPDADLSTFEPTDYERGDLIYIVHGTPSSDIPVSGTATYDGRVSALEWPSDAAVFFSDSDSYSGKFDMTASFNETGANVMVSFSFGDDPAGPYQFDDVVVTGNQLSLSGLSATEGLFAGYQNIGIRGAFFGPAAAEVGGVFEGENPTANTLMHGFFAGGQVHDDQ